MIFRRGNFRRLKWVQRKSPESREVKAYIRHRVIHLQRSAPVAPISPKFQQLMRKLRVILFPYRSLATSCHSMLVFTRGESAFMFTTDIFFSINLRVTFVNKRKPLKPEGLAAKVDHCSVFNEFEAGHWAFTLMTRWYWTIARKQMEM